MLLMMMMMMMMVMMMMLMMMMMMMMMTMAMELQTLKILMMMMMVFQTIKIKMMTTMEYLMPKRTTMMEMPEYILLDLDMELPGAQLYSSLLLWSFSSVIENLRRFTIKRSKLKKMRKKAEKTKL